MTMPAAVCCLERTYYSIGGGFIAEMRPSWRLSRTENHVAPARSKQAPYSFKTAKEMLDMGRASGLSIAAMKRANEEAVMSPAACEERLHKVWSVMDACIGRGFRAEGQLPGGLKVKRRAKALREKLMDEMTSNAKPPHSGQ